MKTTDDLLPRPRGARSLFVDWCPDGQVYAEYTDEALNVIGHAMKPTLREAITVAARLNNSLPKEAA